MVTDEHLGRRAPAEVRPFRVPPRVEAEVQRCSGAGAPDADEVEAVVLGGEAGEARDLGDGPGHAALTCGEAVKSSTTPQAD